MCLAFRLLSRYEARVRKCSINEYHYRISKEEVMMKTYRGKAVDYLVTADDVLLYTMQSQSLSWCLIEWKVL